MRTLYLVSKRLPRVCMGGSHGQAQTLPYSPSAPRVHGWFRDDVLDRITGAVCPACAWVVPPLVTVVRVYRRLPRVCMGGSDM